jgi:hypothetical protein
MTSWTDEVRNFELREKIISQMSEGLDEVKFLPHEEVRRRAKAFKRFFVESERSEDEESAR